METELAELESAVLEAPQTAAPSFTFSSGLTVRLRRVNPLFISKVRAAARKSLAGQEVKPPTFAVDLAGGDQEVKPHTDDTIKMEPWASDADTQSQWRKWKAWQQKVNAEEINATFRAHALRGVVEDGPPEAWLEERRYYKLDVPEKPLDLKWEWLFDASTGWDEMLRLVLAIQQIPSELEELAAAAADGFRRSLG